METTFGHRSKRRSLILNTLLGALLGFTGALMAQSAPPRGPTGSLPPPPAQVMPDVAASIHQDIMDYGTRYRPKITLENKGNGPMPAVDVTTIVVPDTHWPGGRPPTPEECMTDPKQPCEKDYRKIGPLLPGQKDSFHVGKKRVRTTTLFVQVNVSCTLFPPDKCVEATLQNNVAKRVLGPH